MPGSSRNPRAEWRALRIPGAQFLDLDEVASAHTLGLKHMMPSPETFAKACEDFGVSPDSHVVIYDSHGIFSSPRALYMFRAFGHALSSILDGGLPAWIAYGCPTETGDPLPVESAAYPAPQLDTKVVKSYEQVVANSRFNPANEPLADLVLDARSKDRYLGTAPEPRAGLSSGHIPYAFSLPFTAFLDTRPMPSPPPATAQPLPAGSSIPALGAHPPDATPRDPIPDPPALTLESFPASLPKQYATLKPTTQILDVLRESLGPDFAGEVLEGKRGVTASCGSGMTAGVLWLGLQAIGATEVGIYDESWTGYAMRKESKITKGEEKRA